MIRTSKPITVQIAVLTAGLTACESQVDRVRRYSGLAVTQTVPSSKGDLAITNRNGSVWVDTGGDTGQIAVIGRPFASGRDDAEAEQIALRAMAELTLTAKPDGAGGTTVVGGGDDSRGLDLVVHLPYPFGGLLSITAINGYVHYVGSSGARGATITVTTGDIFVQDGGKTLTIKGGQSNVNVITLPTVTGTSITTEYGNITAQVPDSANLLITASTKYGGTVTPPPNRSVEDNGDNSGGAALTGLAVSTVAPGHKSATIQLGDLGTIKELNQYLTVSTSHGNVVFR